MASRRRQVATLPDSGDPPVASRPKRARKPTLRARQQPVNSRGDAQDGPGETPLMGDNIQVTQQRAGGLNTDGSPVLAQQLLSSALVTYGWGKLLSCALEVLRHLGLRQHQVLT